MIPDDLRYCTSGLLDSTPTPLVNLPELYLLCWLGCVLGSVETLPPSHAKGGVYYNDKISCLIIHPPSTVC